MSPTDRGFTLVEAIVAIALMTALFVGVAYVITTAASTNARARATTLATLAAVDALERLQALPFDDAALAPSPADALANDLAGYSDVPLGGYTRRWSVEPLPSMAGTALVLRVVVSQRAGRGAARLIAIRTQVGR